MTHFEERDRAKWLLSDLEERLPLTTRPNRGLKWQVVGPSLRVLGDHPAYRESPVVVNDGEDCCDLKSAFPEFSAVGARPLQRGLINRLVFEMRSEPTAKPHIQQVGVVQLEAGSKLLRASMVCTSGGDMIASSGGLEVVHPGSQSSGLVPRLEDWCSGGPRWLEGEDRFVQRVMLEVDLRNGCVALSVDGWVDHPATVLAPILADDASNWFPMVSLTAGEQQARLIDFQVRSRA